MQVTDLGLDLRGVDEGYIVAAQGFLDHRIATPGEVRRALRRFCGPEQEAAELLALFGLESHVLVGDRDTPEAWHQLWDTRWCPACECPFPCPPVEADVRVLGLYQ